MYRCLSLFSGIGGIDLAFERAGFEIIGQVEIDDYCNRVLEKHWPNVTRFRDVKTFRASDLASPVDVVCGGFPCQDISLANAGKRTGIKQGTRSGLWFEFARIIGELRPRFVFIENVPAVTTNGGTTVFNSLASLGYDAQWSVVPAFAVGAPHKRERWYCVAHSNIKRYNKTQSFSQLTHNSQWFISACEHTRAAKFHETVPSGETVSAGVGLADSCCTRLEIGQSINYNDGQEQPSVERSGRDALPDTNSIQTNRTPIARSERSNGTTESRLGGIFDGLPARLDAIRRQSRWPAPPGQPQYRWEKPRTTQGEANRSARLKALGNAVVPQVIQPFAEGIRETLETEALPIVGVDPQR